ncbi:MAG: hypothetical protein ACRDBO_05830 [Lachnospiraceae bacterium]
MRAALYSAFPQIRKIIEKPYTIKVNKKSGELYLEQEKNPLFMEAPYAILLILASVFAIYSCCSHIQLWTDVNLRIRRLEQLERQAITLKNENELTERKFAYTGDLNYIYEVATNTLGMVPASEANVIFYDHSDPEFVYQRDNIPSIE